MKSALATQSFLITKTHLRQTQPNLKATPAHQASPETAVPPVEADF